MKTLMVAALAILLAGPALAGHHGKGSKDDRPNTVDATVGGTILDRVLTEEEKRILRDWLGGREAVADKKKKGNLPPGLAKRDTLPPGLAKQLERNGRLPPGLEKRELPAGLKARLPRRSDDLERVIVDNDIVLIEKGTRLILDVLKDVLQ